MSQLFDNKEALEDLQWQPAPRRGRGGNASERVLRLASIARLGAHARIFSRTVRRSLLQQHALSLDTNLDDPINGQTRVLRSMAPGAPNHDDTLALASPSERRGVASLRDRRVLAWVVKPDHRLRVTFGSTLFVLRNPRYPCDGLRLADSISYVSAEGGDSSYVQAHHVFQKGRTNQDSLIAPLDPRANNLASGLVFVNAVDDDFGFALHLRASKLKDMCDLMDAFRGGRINPPVVVEEEKKTEGRHLLWDSFGPGGENHDFLEPLSDDDDLLAEAGLNDGGEYYRFTADFLQSMPFVSPDTVLEYHPYKSRNRMCLVYGVCAITGVTFTKTNGESVKLDLHHISFRKKHVFVGFIYKGVNTGLGALGPYKSK